MLTYTIVISPYLVSISCLLLFTVFNTQTIVFTESSPSLTTYDRLQTSYNYTMKCPCSIRNIPFKKFISFTPTFHSVCSSNFISDAWISLLIVSNTKDVTGGLSQMIQHFRILSALCLLAENTVSDALERFSVQSLITSNVLDKISFSTQLNTTIEQFIQSLVINFGLLTDATLLLTQVDQPFTKQLSLDQVGLELNSDPAVKESDLWQVCSFLFIGKRFTSIRCIVQYLTSD